ncbi:MAG: hypothetical protein IPJ09_19465 [Saprospiraceae bacterium]|nr:hypothetical protein [Saprospiraceae bacterium]
MNKTALTKHQLSEQLGISLRTLQRKLHQAGLNIPRGLISIDNQHIIRENWAIPPLPLIDSIQVPQTERFIQFTQIGSQPLPPYPLLSALTSLSG